MTRVRESIDVSLSEREVYNMVLSMLDELDACACTDAPKGWALAQLVAIVEDLLPSLSPEKRLQLVKRVIAGV